MSDIQKLIDRCLRDARNPGMANLASQAQKAAQELARLQAIETAAQKLFEDKQVNTTDYMRAYNELAAALKRQP